MQPIDRLFNPRRNILLIVTGVLLAYSQAAYSVDAAQMLVNFSQSFPAIQRLIVGAAYLLGLSFMFRALYNMKIYGEARAMMSSQSSLKEPVAYFVTGTVFIFLPTALDIFMNTTFGTSNILSYQQMPGQDKFEYGKGFLAVLRLVQLVGLIAFVRGWILVAKASTQQGGQMGYGKGLTHIIGGVFAINIVGTMQILSNTFGIFQ